MRRQTLVFGIAAALSLFTACNGGGGAPGGGASPATDENGGQNSTDTASSTGTGTGSGVPAPSASAGQVALTLPTDVDPATVEGYVVGKQNDLKVQQAGDGTYYVDQIPPGEVDIIITAGTVAVSTSLAGTKDRGIRLSDVKATAGAQTALGAVQLPKLGSISGTVMLSNPGADQHLGIDVFIPGTSYAAKSAADGKYTISNVPQGRHNLAFMKQSYFTGRAEKVDVAEQTDTVAPDITIAQKTGVTGFIEIAGGQASTGDRKVLVIVGASEDATLMMISEDNAFTGKTYGPLVTTTSYTFDSDGPKKLFVRFANEDGQETNFESNSVRVDTTAPTAVFTSGVPTGTNATGALDVAVHGGDGTDAFDLTQYRAKVGASSNTDCAVEAGYGAPTPKATNFTASLTGLPDGALKLCAVGGDALDHWQAFSGATVATWTKDRSGPTIESSIPTANATGVTPTTNLRIVFDEPARNLSGTAGGAYDNYVLTDTTHSATLPVIPQTSDSGRTIDFSLSGSITMGQSALGRLAAGTSYTLTAQAELEDSLDNANQEESVSFTTGAGWGFSNAVTSGASAYAHPTGVAGASQIYNVQMVPFAAAVSSSGKRAVAWHKDNRVYAAIFNGTTWSAATEIGDNLEAHAPKIGMDDAGNAIVAYQMYDSGAGEYRIHAKRFDGTSWSASTNLTGSIGTEVDYSTYWDLAVAPNGNAFVAFRKDNLGLKELHAREYISGSWQAATDAIASSLSLSAQIKVAAANNSRAAIVYAANDQDIMVSFYNRQDNETVTDTNLWDTPIQVANYVGTTYMTVKPSVAINAAGNALIGWNVDGGAPAAEAKFCQDQGNGNAVTCGATTVLHSGGTVSVANDRTLVVASPTGAFLAAWTADNVIEARRHDGTSGWSAAAVSLGSSSNAPMMRAAALSSTGVGYLAWSEVSSGGISNIAVRAAHSTGASTWSTPASVSHDISCANDNSKNAYFPHIGVAGTAAYLHFIGCAGVNYLESGARESAFVP